MTMSSPTEHGSLRTCRLCAYFGTPLAFRRIRGAADRRCRRTRQTCLTTSYRARLEDCAGHRLNPRPVRTTRVEDADADRSLTPAPSNAHSEQPLVSRPRLPMVSSVEYRDVFQPGRCAVTSSAPRGLRQLSGANDLLVVRQLTVTGPSGKLDSPRPDSLSERVTDRGVRTQRSG